MAAEKGLPPEDRERFTEKKDELDSIKSNLKTEAESEN
jgi:hypothetical protein